MTGIDHVVFCVADQWRGDALGFLGTPGVVTPHLDALAADSVTFTNHFCGASPCGPSRRTMHTGTTIETHGQWTNHDASGSELRTLAATVRTAGIEPTLVGYTDTPQPGFGDGDWRRFVDPAFAVAQPFVWQQNFPFWSAALAEQGAPPPAHPFGPYAPAGPPDADGLAPAHYPAELSDVQFLNDAALAQLDRLPNRSLLHVNWLRPHPPMTPPAPWHRLVDPAAVSLPNRRSLDELTEMHPYFRATVPDRSMTEYTQVRSRLGELTEATERHIRAAYYGLCAEVDHAVGQLVDGLRARGLWERTLFIFTSDHGESLGDHWMWGRRGPYDGHVCVPCIIHDPRQSADRGRGTRRTELTGSIDLVPTICDALGIAPPVAVEGRSLAPLVAGDAPDWREHITFAMSWADHAGTFTNSIDQDLRMRVVRTDQYRLVQFPTMPPLLHDLVEDPHEHTNLADEPAARQLIDQLSALS